MNLLGVMVLNIDQNKVIICLNLIMAITLRRFEFNSFIINHILPNNLV